MTGKGRAAWPLIWLLWACAPALSPLPTNTAGVAGQKPDDAATLYASIRKVLRELNGEPSAERREDLAVEAVKLGQRCDQAAPGNALCDYGLALALGAQARERPATARDGLPIMAERLQKAAASDPALDHAGPERVLGLVLVREPGYAPNWLAVAEAADVMGDARARREAAQTAVALAKKAESAGEPDAATWQRDAQQLLGK
jgi:hypothetical protein